MTRKWRASVDASEQHKRKDRQEIEENWVIVYFEGRGEIYQ